MRNLLLAALLGASVSTARAQADSATGAPPTGRLELRMNDQDVDVSVGAFQPTAHFGIVAGDRSQEFGATGYALTVDYFHDVLPWASLGLEGAYLAREQHGIMNASPAAGPPASITQVRGDSYTAMLMTRVRPAKFGWRPYLLAGIGLSRTHMEVTDDAPPGLVWAATGSPQIDVAGGDSVALAWTSRVGIEYADPHTGAELGFEAGYWRISPHTYPQSGDVANLPTPLPQLENVVSAGDGITLMLKGSIRFGGGLVERN